MVQSMRHRGPDDEGEWIDSASGVFLGFRRLSIIDLSEAGHQPMTSASGRYVVTFNGEIYNGEAIRDRLKGPVGGYRGHSDTEVLLTAFEEWGVRPTLDALRGMFAIALWDRSERSLWLARDRMGVKPLYLLETPRGIAFASEARAFHACPLFEGGIDPAVARRYLRRLYVPGRASLLEGVERLAPGEVVRFDVAGSTIRRAAHEAYWNLEEVAREGAASILRDPDEVLEGFIEVFREAVRLRLYADVPVGAFLSGGIDSTAVVGLMQELSSEPVRTFTVGFDEAGFDESGVAAEVAARIGTRHTPVYVPPQELLDLVDDLPRVCDEPMANPSIIPTILVSRVARRDVTVALSGDGGDECFGGYNRYLRGEKLICMRNRLPGGVRRGLADALAGAANLGLTRAVSRGMTGQHTLADRARKVSRVLGARSEAEAYETLLDVGWTGERPQDSAGLPEAEGSRVPAGLLSRMMLYDQREYLPDDLLTKVDRASMWESLEARVPLLDHEVVRFSWRVDPRLKIRNGRTKWPIRCVAARYVPESLLDRPKMGFTVPIARWLRNDLREWTRDTLSAAATRRSGLLEPKSLEAAWQSFDAGRTDLALGLWAVLLLERWASEWGVSIEG
jgi:asparagine synthase (glutamine-hydrolysing)